MYQRFRRKKFSGWIVGAFALLLGLAGCAGAGGDDGAGLTPLAYTGSAAPAAITAANASQLAGAVLGASNFTGGFAAGAVATPAGGSSRFAASIPAVAAAIQRAVALAPVGQAPVTGVAVPIFMVIPGAFGGTLTISGSIDDFTLTGNLNMTFANYSDISGEVMNGTMNATINSFDLGNFIPLNVLMSFSNFTYTGSTGSFTMQGSILAVTSVAANSETLTANLVGRDNATGETGRVDNLVVFSLYDDVLFPTTASVTITGRVFEPTEGYVDVATTAPLIFTTLAGLFPDGGGPVILTGATGSAIRITPQSAVDVQIEVDADGNGVYETSSIVPWTSL